MGMALERARAALRWGRPDPARGLHGGRRRPALALVLLAGAVLSASTATTGAAGAVGLPHGWGRGAVLGERISVAYDDGSGRTVSRTLRCGGEDAGGEEGNGREACRRLEAVGGPIGPVPAGRMCSMVYGGPQTAHVTGRWHGRPVDETYRRTNGCEIARWNSMVPALPAPGGLVPEAPQ
jgi:hypothetical protein